MDRMFKRRVGISICIPMSNNLIRIRNILLHFKHTKHKLFEKPVLIGVLDIIGVQNQLPIKLGLVLIPPTTHTNF